MRTERAKLTEPVEDEKCLVSVGRVSPETPSGAGDKTRTRLLVLHDPFWTVALPPSDHPASEEHVFVDGSPQSIPGRPR